MDILGLVDVPLWLMLVLTLLLLLYVYGTWNHSVWKSQGVPGPKPWPLLGNIMEIREKSYYYVFGEWQRKHGHVVGFYEGVRPILAITDLSMIQEVMLKQFNNFTERNFFPRPKQPLVKNSVFFAFGSRWKRIRNLMTPAFSSHRLKKKSSLVNRCSRLLVQNIENKARAGQLLDIREVFQAFTLDVIAGTTFGLETNSQTQKEEPFTQNCRTFFDNVGLRGMYRFVLYLFHAFPFLERILEFRTQTDFGRKCNFFFTALEQIVDERLAEKNNTSQKPKSADLIQMLVDTEADPDVITDRAENTDNTKSYRCMTKEEIMAQGFILLIAGFESTATTLQYLTYNLILYPHIQERIFEEIRDHLGDDDPTYENVSQLKYLDAALRESLRMFSPFPIVDRKAERPMTVKGVHIPAGCGVTIPVYSILHDPEHFPDPEVFNPDRFLEENAAKIHPVVSELVFGYGPRKCIGMRLALLEIKLASVVMFRRLRFVKCAETPKKITLGKTSGLAAPDVDIKAKVELRSG